MQIQCITIQCSESVRYNALEYNANTVQCSLSGGMQYNPNTMQQGIQIQCITILYNTILQRTQCSLGGQGECGLDIWMVGNSAPPVRPSFTVSPLFAFFFLFFLCCIIILSSFLLLIHCWNSIVGLAKPAWLWDSHEAQHFCQNRKGTDRGLGQN